MGQKSVNTLLVQDGVIVDDMVFVGHGLSGMAYFSANELKVSVDGFRLVRNEEFANYRSYLQSLFIKNRVTLKDFNKLTEEYQVVK